MIKKITLIFSALTLFTIIVNAQNLSGTYTFDSVKTTSGLIDPTAVPTDTGVVFGSFTAVGTAANPNSTGRFSFTGWPTGSVNGDTSYSQLTGAINTAEYYEVTLTPATNYSIDLYSITFKVQRSGTGIRTYSVRSGVDGFAANLPASINPANVKLSVQAGDVFFINKDSTTTGQSGSTITLGTGFTSLTGAVTFRFYGWNSEGSGGTFSIDNVAFTGNATQALSVNAHLVSENHYTVFPNPSVNGIVNIDLSGASLKSTVTIYNVIGKKIAEKEYSASGIQQIDLSGEANGIYFVKIVNGKEEVTKKVNLIK